MFRPAIAPGSGDAPAHKPELQASRVQGASAVPFDEWDPYEQYVLDTDLAAELAILRAQINATLPSDQLLELIRDTMAATLVAGTGITVVHNDASDIITITATGTGAGGSTDPEVVRDTIAAALFGANGVTVTYDDPNDRITISVSNLAISQVNGLQSALTAIRNLSDVSLASSLNTTYARQGTQGRADLGLGTAALVSTTAFEAAGSIASEATARNAAISAAITALINGAPTGSDTLAGLATRISAHDTSITSLLTSVGQTVPKWQPSQSYTTGVVVMAPDGTMVRRITTGTSTASFDTSNWTVVLADPTTLSGQFLATKASLISPAFSGSPTAPTPVLDAGVATKGYVDALVQSVASTGSGGGSVTVLDNGDGTGTITTATGSTSSVVDNGDGTAILTT